MPDVTAELNRMIERMRDQLDGHGVELTRDHLRLAALAALSALTEEGMLLSSDRQQIPNQVRAAIDEIRGGESAPPLWEPHRWVNAVSVKLGQAGVAAGLILEATPGSPAEADFYARFESQMLGVAAIAQEAIASVRAGRLDAQVGQ